MKLIFYFSLHISEPKGGFKIKVFIFANKLKFKKKDYVRHCIKS